MADSDDPFLRPDATLLRPRPGAGKRGLSEPPPPARGAAPLTPEGEPIPTAMRALLGVGLNPLVRAASPLLILAGQLRGSLTPMDVPGLRQHALDEIRRFEEQARASEVPHEVAVAARYALCAALDEAVLSTPWGAQSEWSQHPLLVALHREAWGGEKFFEMLERISQDPPRYIDLMELQYLLLAFGFGGKYQVRDRGHEALHGVQQELYRKIRSYRGAPEADLSLRWQGVLDRRNRLTEYVPWWVVGAASLALVALTFVAYRASLAGHAEPIKLELAKVGYEVFSAPPSAPVRTAGPTLKQLLAPEETAGTLKVEEDGPKTTVTLIAADLFGSGSATVTAGYERTLQRVSEALNKVPGPVMIIGHTDDQRIRSLKFQDNIELSRERAVSVARILEQHIDNRARLNWNGVGSSQPLYQPESDPANRSRNRRVEIVHVRGG